QIPAPRRMRRRATCCSADRRTGRLGTPANDDSASSASDIERQCLGSGEKKFSRCPVAPTIGLNNPSSTVVRGRFASHGATLGEGQTGSVISNKTRHDEQDL